MEINTTKQQIQVKDKDVFSTVFRLAMWWKILYGVYKVVLGLVLIKWVAIDPANLFYQLMSTEMIEDPNDLFVRIASPIIEHVTTGTTMFVALYLIFWGIVDDIFLSINILRDKLWAFPFTLTLIALFIPYELYRVFHTHSLILVGIIIFDIAIFTIVANEYKKLKQRKLMASDK